MVNLLLPLCLEIPTCLNAPGKTAEKCCLPFKTKNLSNLKNNYMDFTLSDTGNMLLNRDVQGNRQKRQDQKPPNPKKPVLQERQRKEGERENNHGLNNIGE